MQNVRDMNEEGGRAGLSLRDRRRRQTARDIQMATLGLILKHGYAAVTTEMIAAEAGISQRSFFNYYANKEAAAVGHPGGYDADLIERFTLSTGDLVEDLARLVRDQFHRDPVPKDTIRHIDGVLRLAPDLLPAFHASLATLSGQLAAALVARLGDGGGADLLAHLLPAALGRAFRAWSHDDAMTPDDLAAVLAADLRAVGALLAQSAIQP